MTEPELLDLIAATAATDPRVMQAWRTNLSVVTIALHNGQMFNVVVQEHGHGRRGA